MLLDWREHAKLLKLRFPTQLHDAVATYEIPYGTIERPAERRGGARPALDRRLGPRERRRGPLGLASSTTPSTAFDVLGGEIGVTAVRSPIYAHHEPTIPRAGVRYQFMDQGIQRFTLALRAPPRRLGRTPA